MKKFIEKITFYLIGICFVLALIGFIFPTNTNVHKEIKISTSKSVVSNMIYNINKTKIWNVFVYFPDLEQDVYIKEFGLFAKSSSNNIYPRFLNVVAKNNMSEFILLVDQPNIKSIVIKIKEYKKGEVLVSCEVNKKNTFPNNLFSSKVDEERFSSKMEQSLENLKKYCENL